MSQGPYHLFSIAVLLLLGYLLSLLAVRIRMVSLQNHRKFWNTLLLLFFISAGILGLILAIRVNYKLELTWADRAMQWHVDLGIGLVVVAAFHLTWHLTYYKRLLKGRTQPGSPVSHTAHLDLPRAHVRLLFILIGAVSMIAQLVLLRECIKTFQGNELVIGVYLAVWMILTSAGARAGSIYTPKLTGKTISGAFLFLGGFPLVIYFFLIVVSRYLFLPGYEPGMFSSAVYILLSILLFTLVSGFLFGYLAGAIKGYPADASLYMYESLGSLTGGAIFGLILVFLMDNIQVLALLFLATAGIMTFRFKFPEQKGKAILLLALTAIITLTAQIPLVRVTLEGLRYPGAAILKSEDTPYGNLTFTSRESQVTGYLDQNPIVTSYDPAQAEEQIHYASLQHHDPQSFLLIGGALSGLAAEVAKYDPPVFDYCDINPYVYRKGRRFFQMEDSTGFRFISIDGRSWLAEEKEVVYDVIVSASGDPLTIGWNRYFTEEYFRLVKSNLSDSGIFSMQLTVGGNYIGDAGIRSLSINYQTLKKVFEHVIAVPGIYTCFLASSHPLSVDFLPMLRKHNIETVYVNQDYLDPMRLAFDSEQLMQRIDTTGSVTNSDLRPILFFHTISSWHKRTGGRPLGYMGLLSLVLFVLFFIFFSREESGLYVAGFSGAGIQMLIILVVQALYGFVYMAAPVLITVFMAGIVLGTYLWNRKGPEPSIAKLTGLLWLMALIAAAGVILLDGGFLMKQRAWSIILLGLMNFLPGLIVGIVFGLASEFTGVRRTGAIGRLYAADLAGAALGSLIPPIFLLPLLGVTNTFILLCGINAATGMLILTKWQRR